MNILPQMNLFEESEFDFLGDLERLQRVLGALDDAGLIRKLYRIRGKGRNDWPCEAMWNSFIASFLFEHPTVESLLRELRRNKQLRTICGFEPKPPCPAFGTTMNISFGFVQHPQNRVLSSLKCLCNSVRLIE